MPRPNESRSGPDFIIAGVMKGGTTALANLLRTHPDVRVVNRAGKNEGEFHFFDQLYGTQTAEWYRAKFDAARPAGGIVGEKTPGYIANPRCLLRMASDVPRTNVIVILRDPVTRFLSQVEVRNRSKNLNRTPLECFEEPQLRERFLWRGIYHPQVALLQTLFGPEQLRIVYADDLRRQPVEVINGLFTFLGLASRDIPQEPTEDERLDLAASEDAAAAALREFYRPHDERLYELLGDEQIRGWSSLSTN